MEELNLLDEQESVAVKIYPYFYFMFFVIVSVCVVVWAYFYLDSISFTKYNLFYLSVLIFAVLSVMSVFNYWADKKLLMKYLEKGTSSSVKINLAVYSCLALLVLIASPFLWKSEGKGIGKIIFFIFSGYFIMQIVFYWLRLKEIKTKEY